MNFSENDFQEKRNWGKKPERKRHEHLKNDINWEEYLRKSEMISVTEKRYEFLRKWFLRKKDKRNWGKKPEGKNYEVGGGIFIYVEMASKLQLKENIYEIWKMIVTEKKTWERIRNDISNWKQTEKTYEFLRNSYIRKRMGCIYYFTLHEKNKKFRKIGFQSEIFSI